jgi:hypothetical protein
VVQNQRQRGENAWATHLNAIRDLRDPAACAAAYDALRPRLLASVGGTADDAFFDDAPRLYARNEQVCVLSAIRPVYRDFVVDMLICWKVAEV